MKKNIIKRISSMLALVMLSTIAFTSCSTCSGSSADSSSVDSSSSSSVDGEKPTAGEIEKVRYTRGIHDLTATETNKWFVQNGQTDYKILLPNSSADVMYAKEELIELFYEATGINLTVETEDTTGKTHSANQKYISLGNTKMFQSAGISLDEKVFGDDGVRIVTKDDTIYINGGKKNGVLYGVYDFLQIYFDYDFFYDEFYTLNTGVTDAKLLNFDVSDVPDVMFRVGSAGYNNVNGTVETRSRFRYNFPGYGGSEGFFMTGHAGHNTHRLISVESEGYETYSRDWLSDNGNQLCYTAHGNEEAYDKMVEQIAKKFTEDIIANVESGKNRIDMSITIEDNTAMCSCQACVTAEEKYGSKTAPVIQLCNNVMHEVKDVWMNSPEGLPYKNEEIRCCFFAYQLMIDPPTCVFNEETGCWEVEYEEVKMRDDVGVWLCFTKPYQQGLSFYSAANDTFREWFSKWSDISSFMHTWAYQANFANYMDFYNSFEFYSSDLMQFCIDKGVKLWWNQNVGNSKDVTAFNGLKEYLQSKLVWDCTLDTEALTNKYFKAMYGEAASVMREYFNYSKQIAMQLRHEFKPADNTGGTWGTNNAKYQPYPVLRKKMAYCDEAMTIIERIYKEQNPEKYAQYKFHIDLEWVSPTYHLMGLHQNMLSEQEYWSIGRRWYEAQKNMDIMCNSEMDKLGIAGTTNKFAP